VVKNKYLIKGIKKKSFHPIPDQLRGEILEAEVNVIIFPSLANVNITAPGIMINHKA